ncbi:MULTISPECIES: NAD(P)-binding domain-containing protein [unclassified Leifsonia]|uniref:NAD(P)-binding domain-containing protein n=1 Tax=unclassified Leifsonia TaxID=2663824 RepID=UPI0008A79900|nr:MULTISPECIES: NAD(P)-binding domain-containing protein [unclassified Leifsonia]SEI02681.1 Pyridine nucleotide-disulphide oxidoreductase [Leifsonia sp. CL154]SFL71622.1 Pyridine nucleotide-disulphide oxidoreductase [Leifsonia sp. CL147]
MTLVDLTTPTVRSSRLVGLPVAIIGAGPIGLAAAANLVERGIDFVVYEAGEDAGASIQKWAHIRFFSPWRHLIDPASLRLLEGTGWAPPEGSGLPTGGEFVASYLRPLSKLEAIDSRIRYGATVDAVSREGMDRTRSAGRADTPFLLRIADANGVQEVTARAVIDASGTYLTPNRLASSGLDPLGLPAVAGHVSHALPDVLGRERHRFAGKRVTVVGAGHSAANTLLNLAALKREVPETQITWLIRNAGAVRVTTSDDDGLAARAAIGKRVDRLIGTGGIHQLDRFEILRVAPIQGGVRLIGQRAGEVVEHDTDVVVNATGFRPNLDVLREIRLELDEIVEAPARLAPLIDPNVHTCGTVEPHGFAELQHPEPDFFLAGMKSYGRAPTFLLATGYEQVRSITAYLAGDIASATKVQLVLPATGVCSTGPAGSSSCCS